MIRAIFFIISAIPVVIVIFSYLFDKSIIDALENNGSYHKGAYSTDGTWFFIAVLGFYAFFYKIWNRLTELDEDFDFTFGLMFLQNKKYRKFKNIEKMVKEEYKEIVNTKFPTNYIIDSLNIYGSYYKAINYDTLYIIVKCKLPDKKFWYSLHFIGKEKRMIFSKDKKSLKKIMMNYIKESI